AGDEDQSRREEEGAQQRERPLKAAPVQLPPARLVHVPRISRTPPNRISRPLLESRDGPRRRLPRHRGLDADRAARAGGRARAARRRAAAFRLRRGDAAPVAAFGGRPPRPAGDLLHALPRRPHARTAGAAEDVRAARAGRDAAHAVRAGRPARAVQALPAVRRATAVSRRARRARAGGDGRARRVRDRAVRRRARPRGARLRARRAGAAGTLRRRGGRRARGSARPRAREAPGRRARRGRGADRDRGGRPRRASVGPDDRAHRRHRAVSGRRPGGAWRGPPRPRGELSRGGEGPGPRDESLDCRGGGGGREARAGALARADARLAALLRAGARRRGARGLPRHGRAARLRRDRGSLRGARRTDARRTRRAAAAAYDPRRMSGMVQVAVAGDVAEAEEMQEILSNAGIESSIEQSPDEDTVSVSVPESELETAKEAIEALTEPDELISEP